MRRRSMPKNQKFDLQGEDMRESKELRHYYFSTLTTEVAKSFKPGRTVTASEAADAQKAAESRAAMQSRTSGNAEWVRNRGEDGRGRDGQERPDDAPR